MPKSLSKQEREHIGKVAALGCILCGGPAEVHHLTGAGMGLRSSNYDTIPLCPFHHRLGNFGEAVHNGTKEFEKKYGTQRELLERTRAMLKECE